MRRVYYGSLMRAINYLPIEGEVNVFSYTYRDRNGTKVNFWKRYEDSTPQGIVDQMKSDGIQVWGEDVLDYEFPRNAYEFLLWRAVLTARGYSEADVNEILEYSPNVKSECE